MGQLTAAGPGYEAARETSHRARLVAAVLPTTPARAVDLCAGTGWLTELLTLRGWEVTAVESDPATAAGIAERSPAATVVTQTLTGADLSDITAGASAVFGFSALHHIEDHRQALETILAGGHDLVVVEIPARSEANDPNIAGGPKVAHLYDLVAYRRPHVIGWARSAYSAALRPIAAWGPDVRAGTVTDGGGHSTREWPDVGKAVAETLGTVFTPGTLNLEVSAPIEYHTEIPTSLGTARVRLGWLNGEAVWLAKLPASDRGDLFTEAYAVDPLRAKLGLQTGDRVALRLS